MSRLYFYKDSKGKLQRYFYCYSCGQDKFTERDVLLGRVIRRGSGSMPMDLCRNCDIKKYPFLERPPLLESLSEEPQIKVNGHEVLAGQLWKDLDKRRPRTITVSRVEGKDAFYNSSRGSELRISTARLLERFQFVR